MSPPKPARHRWLLGLLLVALVTTLVGGSVAEADTGGRRQAEDPDGDPTGPPQVWAKQCKIVAFPENRPTRTDFDPALLSTRAGNSGFLLFYVWGRNVQRAQTTGPDNITGTLNEAYIVHQIENLVMYCTEAERPAPGGRGPNANPGSAPRHTWFRVDIDAFPLDALISDARVPNRDRSNPKAGVGYSPKENKCQRLESAVKGDITGINRVDDLPLQLPRFALPVDYVPLPPRGPDQPPYGRGNPAPPQVVDVDDYPAQPEGDAAVWRRVYCLIGGSWKRADVALGHKCPRSELSPDLGGLIPEECWGTFLSRSYEFHYNGGAWNDLERKLTGFWASKAFAIGKVGTQISLWGIEQAYTFRMDDYASTAIDIGDSYQTNLIDVTVDGRVLVLDVIWLIFAVWIALNLLRGKLRMVAGEVVVSVVLLACSSFLMLHRPDYMGDMFRLINDVSADLLVAGQGDDPVAREGGIEEAIAGTQRELHKIFVETTYDELNWGHQLGDASDPDNPLRECAAARDRILLRGPQNGSAFPREEMDRAGCHAEFEFNENPSSERLIGSLVAAGSMGAGAFVVWTVAMTVLVSKFFAAGLWALVAFPVAAAALPGGLRRLAWLWGSLMYQVTGVVVGLSLVLSMMIITLRRLLETSQDGRMIERLAVVLLVIVIFGMARRRVLAATQASAGRLTDNLTNVRVGGGGAAWAGATATSGANFANIDRGMGYAGRGIGGAASTAGLALGATAVTGLLHWRAGRRQLALRRRDKRNSATQTRTFVRDWGLPMPTEGVGPGPRGVPVGHTGRGELEKPDTRRMGARPGAGGDGTVASGWPTPDTRALGKGGVPTTRVHEGDSDGRFQKPRAYGEGKSWKVLSETAITLDKPSWRYPVERLRAAVTSRTVMRQVRKMQERHVDPRADRPSSWAARRWFEDRYPPVEMAMSQPDPPERPKRERNDYRMTRDEFRTNRDAWRLAQARAGRARMYEHLWGLDNRQQLLDERAQVRRGLREFGRRVRGSVGRFFPRNPHDDFLS